MTTPPPPTPPSPNSADISLLLDESSSTLWSRDELRDVMRHQLDCPLALDLAGVLAGEGTFAQLFLSRTPSRELLLRVKQFAKSPSPAKLPREVATVLYLCAIASARVRLGDRISTLSDDALARGVRWALEQPWLDDASTRGLLGEALKGLDHS